MCGPVQRCARRAGAALDVETQARSAESYTHVADVHIMACTTQRVPSHALGHSVLVLAVGQRMARLDHCAQKEGLHSGGCMFLCAVAVEDFDALREMVSSEVTV